jgi:SAM-dependent methyltransferase
VYLDEDPEESMPVSVFFRSGDELMGVDREALARAWGRVLDGGAGVGALSLLLQEAGLPVTALEVVPEGVSIMAQRGVKDVRRGRLEDFVPAEPFDTILLLMNGTALAGTLAGLPPLLGTLGGLLAPGGQVLLDSTDLLEGEPWTGNDEVRGTNGNDEPGHAYPGELQYQLSFRGWKGSPFPQLFVDSRTLARMAGREGWRTEVVWRGRDRTYLARLTREYPLDRL